MALHKFKRDKPQLKHFTLNFCLNIAIRWGPYSSVDPINWNPLLAATHTSRSTHASRFIRIQSTACVCNSLWNCQRGCATTATTEIRGENESKQNCGIYTTKPFIWLAIRTCHFGWTLAIRRTRLKVISLIQYGWNKTPLCIYTCGFDRYNVYKDYTSGVLKWDNFSAIQPNLNTQFKIVQNEKWTNILFELYRFY